MEERWLEYEDPKNIPIFLPPRSPSSLSISNHKLRLPVFLSFYNRKRRISYYLSGVHQFWMGTCHLIAFSKQTCKVLILTSNCKHTIASTLQALSNGICTKILMKNKHQHLHFAFLILIIDYRLSMFPKDIQLKASVTKPTDHSAIYILIR